MQMPPAEPASISQTSPSVPKSRPSKRRSRKPDKRWYYGSRLSTIAILVIGLSKVLGLWTDPAPTLPGTATEPLDPAQLPLVSQTIGGYSRSYHSVLADSEFNWTGSTGVYQASEGRLHLVTNKHCLGLDQLATSAYDNNPEVSGYRLTVTFSSGVSKEVARFEVADGDLDLAILELDEHNLQAGRDYVLLPQVSKDFPVGGEVVAVGTPLGVYQGTQTFGHLSAFRQGNGFLILQTDAAINHGNSGGPLLLKDGSGYLWAGVNTWREDSASNLGFAIDAHAVQHMNGKWYPADMAGAAQALREQYGITATVH